MKNVVYYDTGKETEFKPNALFEKYLKLLKVDLIKEFKSPRIKLSQCPACRSKRKTEAFVKFGYSYNECLACGSVYMSPRPSDEDLKTHYLTSVSAKYWRETLSEATLKKRKEKIYENRFQWMYEVLKENKPEASSIADFNSRNQAFSNEFMNWSEISQKAIVNPYFISEIDSDYTKGSFDAVCAFEIIDNTSDVEQLLRNINSALKEGGICFLTTISISGFDLQVLWRNSQSIFPIDRINIFSKKGIEILVARNGFNILEYSTPGILDVDKVKNSLKNNPKIDIPRFIRTLMETGSDQTLSDFQEFLQINKLSSFARLVIKKK